MYLLCFILLSSQGLHIFTKNMSTLTNPKKYYLTISSIAMSIEPFYTKLKLYTRSKECIYYILFYCLVRDYIFLVKNIQNISSLKKHYLTIPLVPMSIEPFYTKLKLYTRSNECIYYILF